MAGGRRGPPRARRLIAVRLFTALWPAPEAVAALQAASAGPASAGPASAGSASTGSATAGSASAGPVSAGVASSRAAAAPLPDGWRRVDPSSWHVTLAFHGEAQMGPLARRLEAAVYGAPSPLLRLRGAGAFAGVRWAGVEAAQAERLAELVGAVGGRPAAFVAHVTVLRMRSRPGPDPGPDPPTPWAEHVGPWWRPPEVLLVASEPARGGVRYRPVHRVPLGGADPGVAGG